MDQATVVHVVTAVLALIILVDVSVLWLTGRQVPDLLSQLVLAVFASYFASTWSRGRAASARREGGSGGGSGSGAKGHAAPNAPGEGGK